LDSSLKIVTFLLSGLKPFFYFLVKLAVDLDKKS
jgi:hypothetical protein